MSRRTAATIQRGTHHLPVEDPETPGVCRICRRPMTAKNDRHQLPETDPAVLAAEARRLGEGNTDE